MGNDVFKNLKSLKKVFLKDNVCIDVDFEGYQMLVRLPQMTKDTCNLCDVESVNYTTCALNNVMKRQTILKAEFQSFATKQDETQENIHSRVYLLEAESTAVKTRLLAAKEETRNHMLNLEDRLSASVRDLRRTNVEMKETIEKLQEELEALKNHAGVLFSWKILVGIFSLQFLVKTVLA